jgi:hypothetical protein
LRPEGNSVVSFRWLYKIKHVVYGRLENFKVRFVARGFSQKEGVDYKETFAPFSRYASIQTVIFIDSDEVDDTPNGCENSFPQRDHLGGSMHRETSGF